MKFKRGINLYLKNGQSVTIPADEIWVGYVSGKGYTTYGNNNKNVDVTGFFKDHYNDKIKATIPGPMKIDTEQEGFTFIGLAFTAD
ncbi:Uncharacterised protein [Urinicoccus massiliensis]|uniref:Uncharacterized protein n=1 Tax=Urinicoccus massiliensis TaxID=1723382 RepID=A0A8H2QTR6_9FIRM|nr:hypothetical protein [Urinicoccus massiliensis]VFB17185.1 Uncharacterised protein [Urinicoccus massiliensis]